MGFTRFLLVWKMEMKTFPITRNKEDFKVYTQNLLEIK